MPKNTLNLTLSLDTDTIAAFKAEAEDHTSEQALANQIMTDRYAHPDWPDLAEANVIAKELGAAQARITLLEAEREHAIASATLNANVVIVMAAEIENAVERTDIVANERARRTLRDLGVNL